MRHINYIKRTFVIKHIMSLNKTVYLITIGEPNIDGVTADEFEETLIFVGRLIERLNNEDNYIGKYIYVVEYELSDNGDYIKQNNLFSNRYLIEK
jgi:hypothetical protein